VAFRDQQTDCVLAAWTYLTAVSARDIFPFIASTEDRATSARYSIIFTRHHHVYFTDFTNCIIISLSLHVVSSVCYRTAKKDAPADDVQHLITPCLKLTCPSLNSTRPLKRSSTLVNMPSKTSLERPYNSTGILTHFVLL